MMIRKTSKLILKDGDKYLQVLSKYWSLPGGKAEDEEYPSDALARELLEELGYVIEHDDMYDQAIVTFYEDVIWVDFIYIAKVNFQSIKDKLICGREVSEYRLSNVLPDYWRVRLSTERFNCIWKFNRLPSVEFLEEIHEHLLLLCDLPDGDEVFTGC